MAEDVHCLADLHVYLQVGLQENLTTAAASEAGSILHSSLPGPITDRHHHLPHGSQSNFDLERTKHQLLASKLSPSVRLRAALDMAAASGERRMRCIQAKLMMMLCLCSCPYPDRLNTGQRPGD